MSAFMSETFQSWEFLKTVDIMDEISSELRLAALDSTVL